jgi:DnaA family protein
MNQLILPYQKNIKQTFENYYSDSDLNTQISEGIKNIFSNKNNQIYIWGGKFTGKSHLLYSANNHFSSIEKKCIYLPMKDYRLFDPDIINNFCDYDLICIDDIDCIFGIKDWEYSFFKMINKALDNSKKIIYTSSSSLVLNKINLKDLHSRLSWGLVYRINNPGDHLKEKILNKIIREKEYNISLDVCRYLLNRKDRDLVSLIKIIHKVGYQSLSTKKKISIKSLSGIFD